MLLTICYYTKNIALLIVFSCFFYNLSMQKTAFIWRFLFLIIQFLLLAGHLFPAEFIFEFFLLFSCFKTFFFIEHEFDVIQFFLQFCQCHVLFHVQIHVFCNHEYASNLTDTCRKVILPDFTLSIYGFFIHNFRNI